MTRKRRKMIRLDESLQVCLLAVENRFPLCLIEINEQMREPSDGEGGFYTVEQVLQQLQVQTPQLLRAPARLLIDAEQAISAIYLLDRSEKVPFLNLYEGHNHDLAHRHTLQEPAPTFIDT